METLKNYIHGNWVESHESGSIGVINPANQKMLAKVPFGVKTILDVISVVHSAEVAFKEWRNVPVIKRIQPLYNLKLLLEENIDEIGRLITLECGKNFIESKAEMKRAIENLETACVMPMLMQSEFRDNVATGVDEFMIRRPIGVCACVAPFNLPGMIPFWFLPYAIAGGNSFIIKPSEKVPMAMMKVFELIDQLDIPKGLINLVHGGQHTVDALLDYPIVKAISFVGSANVAQYI